jgi:hypothetical protein
LQISTATKSTWRIKPDGFYSVAENTPQLGLNNSFIFGDAGTLKMKRQTWTKITGKNQHF